MTDANGRGGRTCEYCHHWANARAYPEDVRYKIGDCTAIAHPVVVGFTPGKGVQQVSGGTHTIMFAQGFCTTNWRPKLVGLPLAGNRLGEVASSATPLPPPGKEPA